MPPGRWATTRSEPRCQGDSILARPLSRAPMGRGRLRIFSSAFSRKRGGRTPAPGAGQNSRCRSTRKRGLPRRGYPPGSIRRGREPQGLAVRAQLGGSARGADLGHPAPTGPEAAGLYGKKIVCVFIMACTICTKDRCAISLTTLPAPICDHSITSLCQIDSRRVHPTGGPCGRVRPIEARTTALTTRGQAK